VAGGRMGSNRRGDIVRIYITREAYRLLGQYMFSKYGTYRGMVRVASELLIKAIRSERGEASSQLAQMTQQYQESQRAQQPSETKSPIIPLSQMQLGEGGSRRSSPLDEVEDLVIVRRARKPEALIQAARERGLLAHDFAEDGYRGVVAVYRPSFAEFAKTVAEADNPPLQAVEETARRVLRRGSPRSMEEKVAVMLYVLNREGEILWDGSRWVVPSRAKPAPPLEVRLEQVKAQRAETTVADAEKPETQLQPAPQQQPDEKTKRWLELFEKEFPRLKTAMLVWRVKDAEALRRLAEQHGLLYYAITSEKAVVLRREYVRDACAYANERKWTREAVADMVADTLRSRPHALADDEVAALTLEAALSLGFASYEKDRWEPRLGGTA